MKSWSVVKLNHARIANDKSIFYTEKTGKSKTLPPDDKINGKSQKYCY